MKKFFKKTEGFTLVELIVVIAILGILAGVGTVGYGGYIKKANMASDQQTIASVKNALTLASYSGTLTKDGYVILDKDGIQEEDYGKNTEIADALKAAFGDFSHLAMKYDWSDETKANVVGILQGQGAGTAAAVAGSTYATDVTKVLGDAQHCTNSLAVFLGQMNGNDAQKTYNLLTGHSDGLELEDVMKTAGLLKTDKDGNVVKDEGTGKAQLADASKTTNTQMSNALLLAIASEVGVADSVEQAGGRIIAEWNGAPTGMTTLAGVATNYAYLESSVKYLNDAELTEAFNTMNAEFATAADADAILASMDAVEMKVAEKKAAMDSDATAAYNAQLQKDALAFAGVMNAVSQVKENYSTKDMLSDENMYTSGEVANVASSYVSAATCFDSLPEGGLPEGAVMVTFSNANHSASSVPAV